MTTTIHFIATNPATQRFHDLKTEAFIGSHTEDTLLITFGGENFFFQPKKIEVYEKIRLSGFFSSKDCLGNVVIELC